MIFCDYPLCTCFLSSDLSTTLEMTGRMFPLEMTGRMFPLGKTRYEPGRMFPFGKTRYESGGSFSLEMTGGSFPFKMIWWIFLARDDMADRSRSEGGTGEFTL